MKGEQEGAKGRDVLPCTHHQLKGALKRAPRGVILLV
jgi:hypothetical protein